MQVEIIAKENKRVYKGRRIMKKVYLSHGLGVNSWALYLWLIEQGQAPGEDFEAVAVNHHTDWPETYDYLEMMLAKGYPVTVIEPQVESCNSVYEYCFKYRTLPGRVARFCTARFKIEPIRDYCKRPCVMMVAIDASEPHRARPWKNEKDRKSITFRFPLIEAGFTRDDCVAIIKRHCLPVPIRSNCWICSFQSREQWLLLKEQHPDLFAKAVELERLCNERRKVAGKKPVYYRDRPLDLYVAPKTADGKLLAIRGQMNLGDLLAIKEEGQ